MCASQWAVAMLICFWDKVAKICDGRAPPSYLAWFYHERLARQSLERRNLFGYPSIQYRNLLYRQSIHRSR